MRMKKVLQGTALTALAAAAWAGTVTADALAAEKFDFRNVHFNLDGYEEYYDEDEDYYYDSYSTDVTMRVTVPEGSTEIMVGVASYNKKNHAVKIADSAWEVHDVVKEDYGDGEVY